MRPFVVKLTAFALLYCTITTTKSYGQQSTNISNVVTTAVPFLRIAPDARSAGMGDLGIATPADNFSNYWNIGKAAFNTNQAGISASYTPWLKDILNDIFLASVNGYYKLDDEQALTGSLRYFNLGDIQFTDINGQDLNIFRPREFGLDFGYSRKLSEKTGLGVSLRYIYSNLAGGSATAGSNYKAGNAIAGDIGFYSDGRNSSGSGWSFGAALTNLGSKIAYTDNANQKDYIPANLGLGTAYTKVFNESNKLTFGLDINKLLVPTPPNDTSQQAIDDYRSKSVVASWFSSFGDAPGGFSEELKEFNASIGAEYTYNDQFSLRAGYFYEDKTKGNRRFFTMGLGVKYSSFGLDFSYLLPSGNGVNRNPLSNTLRFTLHFNFEGDGGGSGGEE